MCSKDISVLDTPLHHLYLQRVCPVATERMEWSPDDLFPLWEYIPAPLTRVHQYEGNLVTVSSDTNSVKSTLSLLTHCLGRRRKGPVMKGVVRVTVKKGVVATVSFTFTSRTTPNLRQYSVLYLLFLHIYVTSPDFMLTTSIYFMVLFDRVERSDHKKFKSILWSETGPGRRQLWLDHHQKMRPKLYLPLPRPQWKRVCSRGFGYHVSKRVMV